jgi:hypothetical protein
LLERIARIWLPGDGFLEILRFSMAKVNREIYRAVFFCWWDYLTYLEPDWLPYCFCYWMGKKGFIRQDQALSIWAEYWEFFTVFLCFMMSLMNFLVMNQPFYMIWFFGFSFCHSILIQKMCSWGIAEIHKEPKESLFERDPCKADFENTWL